MLNFHLKFRFDMKVTLLIKRLAMPLLIMATGQAFAFDVEKAATVEGKLRGIAIACGDENFQRTFIDNSKAQVAFALQGSGPVNSEDVEKMIAERTAHPSLQLDRTRCTELVAKL